MRKRAAVSDTTLGRPARRSESVRRGLLALAAVGVCLLSIGVPQAVADTTIAVPFGSTGGEQSWAVPSACC
jgi:hypothetical protein